MTVSNDNPQVCAETPDMDKPSRILKAGFHSLAIIIGIVIGLVEAVLLLILLPRLGVPRENVHGIAGGLQASEHIARQALCRPRLEVVRSVAERSLSRDTDQDAREIRGVCCG